MCLSSSSRILLFRESLIFKLSSFSCEFVVPIIDEDSSNTLIVPMMSILMLAKQRLGTTTTYSTSCAREV